MPKSRWIDFGNNTFALTGGSNIGFIVQGNSALMVDAGLDARGARRAVRQFAALGAELAGVVLTHGHADHFGGAPWIARRDGIPVFAPALEGAFAAQPILQPLFLHGGAVPFAELRGKFTLAKEAVDAPQPLHPGSLTLQEIPVEIVALHGHAPQQVGVGYPAVDHPAPDGRTLYCGDAVFPMEILKRHPILFCADMDAWLTTLASMPDLPYDKFVAGHGEPVTDIVPLVAATAARLREIRSVTHAVLAEPLEPYALLRAVAAHFGVTFTAPQSFLLSLTTINAALTSLQLAGEAEITMIDNRLLWRSCS
ncbi:MAG: MBL fold metallo-hydrolase [Anaerolineae bacterium]|nr:MBL fold metallo-hydrolase [Anaerolineae bacterium]